MNLSLKSNKGNVIWMISFVFILWLGLRENNIAFGDTVNYTKEFLMMECTSQYDIESDKAFYYIMSFFAKTGFGPHFFFLFVEFIYFAGTAIVVNKLFSNQPLLVFAVVLAAFSFYTYSVNGIRNGMACSLFLWMLVYVKERKWTWAVALGLFAINVHSSLYLVVAALLLALYYKNTKVYVAGWLACIALSIVAGGVFETFFQTQGIIDTGKDAVYMSNDNADMEIPIVDTYLRCVGMFMIPLYVVNCYRNGFQGMGYGLLPMLSGVAELIGRGVMAVVAAKKVSYTMACMASPFAWIVATVLLIVLYFYVMKDMKKKLCL